MNSDESNTDEMMERLAKAAQEQAPSPWRRQDFHSDGAKNGVDDADGGVVCASYGFRRPAVFDFIAAAHPMTFLSLIDRLRKAEAERDGLAAKLQEAQQQTPTLIQHREPVTDERGNEVGFTDWQQGPGLPWWPKRELFATPIPTEPVNALTMALLKSAYRDAVEHDESLPFDWAVHCHVLHQALAAAEAQQAEPVRLTRESVARAIWIVWREHEDRCDIELEDLRDSHAVWDAADEVLRANGYKGEI